MLLELFTMPLLRFEILLEVARLFQGNALENC